jgi:FMN phosphatase YigB (HAD superfamily)
MVDIDDTLYPAEDLWARIFREHYGTELGPIRRWDFWRDYLEPDVFYHLVATHFHSADAIRANLPFSGSGAALRAWKRSGVEIHIVSDRAPVTARATRAWLRRNEIPFDATVFRSPIDKVAYAVAKKINLVIDDKPLTLEGCIAASIPAATIAHRFNASVRRKHADIIAAEDWYDLSERLAEHFPRLVGATRPVLAEPDRTDQPAT